jgi:hypothetical protein
MIIHDNFQFHHHIVSEKKIFKNFNQSEAIMSPGSHVGRLIGTKVTPLEQTMQRNIPAKFDHICFSDSLKEDCNFDQSKAFMVPGSHVG